MARQAVFSIDHVGDGAGLKSCHDDDAARQCQPDDRKQCLAGLALQLSPDDACGLRQPAPNADALGQRVAKAIGRRGAHGLRHRFARCGINRIAGACQRRQQTHARAQKHHRQVDRKMQHGQAKMFLVEFREMRAHPHTHSHAQQGA